MRFGIKRLLIVVTATSVLCSLFVAARNIYYSERQQVQRLLEEVENISIISIDGFHDVTENITDATISVKCHPDSLIRSYKLENFESTGKFRLTQIGRWRFVVYGRRYCGAYDAETGEPRESNYYGGRIELGRGSPYSKIIPYSTTTLQDVVTNYQDLVQMFAAWPRKSDPGRVTLSDGTVQYYYVVEDPSFLVD